jgi:D-alanyl-lipoteichoic acid acyltransferase DltB (MBOAT superfamily)
MCWNAKYAGLMLLSTVITYHSGIFIETANEDRMLKRMVVFLSFASNIGILVYFKYFNFFNHAGALFFGKLSLNWDIPDVNVLLPVGISFYTFQALSYTMDVYRGKIRAAKHFGKYALYVSFFPQLVAGPIERSSNLLKQFDRVNKFDYDSMKKGLLLMGFGYFKKVVIADRVAVLVNTVYNKPTLYGGVTLCVATIFFAIQIYCDFSGYTDIAIGSAKVLGYNLMTNFDRPYFSRSISEFWRRWHISLTSWFKEYLYIPLGGNRVPKYRKHINVMIVFLVSGLWHGAHFTFIAWGFLHGAFQIIGNMTKSFRSKITSFLKVDLSSFGCKVFQTLITFGLVCFAWIFFRANNIQDALYIVKNINLKDYWVLFDDSLYGLGLARKEFDVAIISIVILFAVDFISAKINLFGKLQKQHIMFRWIVYFALIFWILIFGSYGKEYNATDFIYFQF